MSDQTLGVDISARWFDVARREDVRRFPNTPDGVAACLAWLAELGGPVRVGMEATGSYHLPLATALPEAGHTVFVCNPLSLARYAEAVLARTKTDAADARRIARFCEAHELAPWSPASPAHQRLHALVATRAALLEQVQRLRNRQGAAGFTACEALVTDLQAPVLAALTAQIARIDRELAAAAAAETPVAAQLRLLVTIPGVGRTTAAALLGACRSTAWAPRARSRPTPACAPRNAPPAPPSAAAAGPAPLGRPTCGRRWTCRPWSRCGPTRPSAPSPTVCARPARAPRSSWSPSCASSCCSLGPSSAAASPTPRPISRPARPSRPIEPSAGLTAQDGIPTASPGLPGRRQPRMSSTAMAKPGKAIGLIDSPRRRTREVA